MSEAVYEIDNVSKHFGAVEALSNVSFTVDAGSGTALIGDNGAGKSTMVKVLSGIHEPTGGELRLDGVPISMQSPAQARGAGIETVNQNLALVGLFNVAEYFFLGRENSGWAHLDSSRPAG